MRLPLTHYLTALAACLASTAVLQSSPTTAHSWLECTDYRMDLYSDDAKIWNPDKCFGRARCGGEQMKVKFGTDTGFNHHDLQCQCKRGSEKDNAPAAKYTPGQRVCLAYPPKNHVAAPCTNAFIPDAGVRITRTKVNPTSDDSFAKDYKQGNGEHTNGKFDYKGFQNCPNFCDDMGGALCTMCFDLEKDIAPGQYTFKWIWAFNSEEDVYTSCWEAQVGEGGGATTGSSNDNGNGNQGNSSTGNNANGNGEQEGSVTSTPTASPPVTLTPATQVTPSAPSPSPTPTVTTGATTLVAANGDEGSEGEQDELDMAEPPVASDADREDELDMAEPSDAGCKDELKMLDADEVGADADTGAGGYGNGDGAGHGNPKMPATPDSGAHHEDASQQQGGGGGYQPSHGNSPVGGDSHPGKRVDGKPGNSGNSDSNMAAVDPECEQGFPLANTEKPESGGDSGAAHPNSNSEHGYGEQKPSEPKGDGNGGGAHGHGHEGGGSHHQNMHNGGDQKQHHGESYSFKSKVGNPYREAESKSENKSSEGAGVVLPYPGE